MIEPTVEQLKARIVELEEAQVMLDLWGLDILEKLGELIRRSATEGPLTTCIECRVSGTEESIPIVWLWATPDDKQPITRIRELAEENARLKRIVAMRLQGEDS